MLQYHRNGTASSTTHYLIQWWETPVKAMIDSCCCSSSRMKVSAIGLQFIVILIITVKATVPQTSIPIFCCLLAIRSPTDVSLRRFSIGMCRWTLGSLMGDVVFKLWTASMTSLKRLQPIEWVSRSACVSRRTCSIASPEWMNSRFVLNPHSWSKSGTYQPQTSWTLVFDPAWTQLFAGTHTHQEQMITFCNWSMCETPQLYSL